MPLNFQTLRTLKACHSGTVLGTYSLFSTNADYLRWNFGIDLPYMVECSGKALRCPLLTRFLQHSSHGRLEEVHVSAKDWEKKSNLNANVVSQKHISPLWSR